MGRSKLLRWSTTRLRFSHYARWICIEKWVSREIFLNFLYSSVRVGLVSQRVAITTRLSVTNLVLRIYAASLTISSFGGPYPNASKRGLIVNIPGGTSRSSFEST